MVNENYIPISPFLSGAIGTAIGEFGGNNNEFEEIVPNWYTKEELRQMLETEMFSARAQLFAYLWANNLLDHLHGWMFWCL